MEVYHPNVEIVDVFCEGIEKSFVRGDGMNLVWGGCRGRRIPRPRGFYLRECLVNGHGRVGPTAFIFVRQKFATAGLNLP